MELKILLRAMILIIKMSTRSFIFVFILTEAVDLLLMVIKTALKNHYQNMLYNSNSHVAASWRQTGVIHDVK